MADLKVWVGCLGCYNAGGLAGKWIDAIDANDVTVAGLHEANKDWVFKNDPYASSHEELWCFDHEGFGDMIRGECSPYEAQQIAEKLEGFDGDEDALMAWVGNLGDLDQALESFEDAFQGQFDSEVAYAQELADAIGFEESGSWPGNHINWEAAARDLFMDGYSYIDGYVFDSNA